MCHLLTTQQKKKKCIGIKLVFPVTVTTVLHIKHKNILLFINIMFIKHRQQENVYPLNKFGKFYSIFYYNTFYYLMSLFVFHISIYVIRYDFEKYCRNYFMNIKIFVFGLF